MRPQSLLRTALLIAVAAVGVSACIQDGIPQPRLVLEQMSPVTCSNTTGGYYCTSEVGMIVLQGQTPLSEILVAVSGAGVSRTLNGNSPVNDLQATYFVQVTNSASTCAASGSSPAYVSAVVIGTGSQPIASGAGQFPATTTCQ